MVPTTSLGRREEEAAEEEEEEEGEGEEEEKEEGVGLTKPVIPSFSPIIILLLFENALKCDTVYKGQTNSHIPILSL